MGQKVNYPPHENFLRAPLRLVVLYFMNLPSLQLFVLHTNINYLRETSLCYKCTICPILGFRYEL